MALDRGSGLLVLNALESNTTLVLDAHRNGTIVRHIAPLANPQGVQIASAPISRLIVADALGGLIHGFDTSSEKMSTVYTTPTPGDADNIRFDSDKGRFVVGYGDKVLGKRRDGDEGRLPTAGLVELEAKTGSVAGVTALPVHAEGFQLGVFEPTLTFPKLMVP